MATNRKINYELIISMSAVMMSFIAVIVSIQQTKIAREQQKAGMWPHLEIFNTHPDSTLYTFVVSNQGVGPAIIKKCEIYIQDTIYQDFQGILIDYQFNGLYSNIRKDKIIQAGQNFEMIKITGSKEMDKWFKVQGEFMKGIKIQYASIYGDCWEISYGFNKEIETNSLGKCEKNLGN